MLQADLWNILQKIWFTWGIQKAEETLSKLPAEMQKELRKYYADFSSKKASDSEIVPAVCSVLNQTDLTGEDLIAYVTKNLPEFKGAQLLENKDTLFEIDPIVILSFVIKCIEKTSV